MKGIPESRSSSGAWGRSLALAVCGALALYGVSDCRLFSHLLGHHRHGGKSTEPLCPQAVPLVPLRVNLTDVIGTETFRHKAIYWLSGAVQIPTESYDGMDAIGKDPRWNTFPLFHDYLRAEFPLTHSNLVLTKVNTLALLYTWQGFDPFLKPILLTAHQDRNIGSRVWGRGSADDKNGLIGIMSAVEALLQQNFKPKRTVILAFGVDEESSGFDGAGALSEVLVKTYGKDSFAMIVDEGSGFSEQFSTVLATPAIAEKGYLDVRAEVTAPGGHSSVPPVHTSIGLLALALVKIEESPYSETLYRSSPVYKTLQCLAEHAPSLPSELRKQIKRSTTSDKELRALEQTISGHPSYGSLLGTTQALDIIHGGVKSNALPEQAWAVINHRIAVESSVAEVKAHLNDLFVPFASKYNLTFTTFGNTTSEPVPASGTFTLSDAYQNGLEPAPVTPTDADSAPYQLLSGTIVATYNSHRAHEVDTKPITVAPGMMGGNTDTRFYWDLSRHIFRYNHNNESSVSDPPGGIHTVNESLDVDSLMEMIRFFVLLILNADEADI